MKISKKQLPALRTYVLLALCGAYLLACSQSGSGKIGMDYAPSGKKTLFFAHQHSYQKDLNNQMPSPAGLIIYTSLTLQLSDTLFGSYELTSTQKLLDQRPELMPVFLLSVDRTQFQRVQNGAFDENLSKLADFLKHLDRPVYLSIGVEVNSPFYKNDPEAYKAAYRYIVDQLNSHQADQVSYIWYVVGMNPGYQNKDPMAWFPGDTYVNWLGTSIYKVKQEHYLDDNFFSGPNYDRLLAIAREKNLPIFVLESSAVAVKKNFDLSGDALWDAWYAPFFEFITDKRVKAFSHLFQDERDPSLKEKWRNHLDSDRFITGNEALFKQIGFDASK